MALPGMPTLTVADDGWSVKVSQGSALILYRTSTPGDVLFIQWIYSLTQDACGYRPLVTLGGDPETQFAAWLQANKGLRLSAGLPRQFGQLATTEYDVSVVAKEACQYTSPVSVIVEGGGIVFYAGERQRLEVASRNDKLILILIQAPSETEFDTFEPLAEQVLNSLTWPPSPTE
jgi:hypothetical protein